MVINLSTTLRAALACAMIVSTPAAYAQATTGSGPTSFSLSGGLFTPSGAPVLNGNVSFKVDVLDATGSCILYSEVHNATDLSASKGRFALDVGAATATNQINNLENSAVLTTSVFRNTGLNTPVASGACGGDVDLNDGDNRVIRISYDLAGGTTWVAMNPDIPMGSAAYAMVSDTVGGKAVTDLVQLRDDAAYDLNQANVENIFSTTNYARLIALLAGNSSQYLSSNPSSTVSFNGQRLANVGTPTMLNDAVNKGYADSTIGGKAADNFSNVGPAAGDGFVMSWDQAANKWVARPFTLANTGVVASTYGSANTVPTFTVAADGRLTAAASVTISGVTPGGAAGGDLTGTYPNPTIGADKIKATNIKSGYMVNRLVATDPVAPNNLTYFECGTNGDALMWTAGGWTCVSAATLLGNSGVTAGTYGNATNVSRVTVDATGRVTAATQVPITYPVTSVNGKSGVITLNALDLGLGTASLKDFGTAAGELVELDGTGRIPAALLPATTGDITDVVAGNGLMGGATSGSAGLSVNAGTGANQIVQLDGTAKLPAVDGSNLTNVNATKLQTRDVANALPADAEVLMWNSSGSRWEPRAVPSAPVASVAGRTGAVTLNYGDLQSAAGVYLTYQPNGAACGNGEMLIWDGAKWVCAPVAGGDITDVVAGPGLLGGAATGSAGLSVNIGSGPNQVVALDGTSKLPAVDGSALTAVNATKLQTYAVHTAAPADGQVLKWNASATRWEAAADDNAGGDITDVVAGNGMLGGGTAGSVAVSVNVGTGANQIVQLDGTSKLPAVDGSNLTNVNSTKLQTRNVAATMPGDSEVLMWNNGASRWEPRAVPSAPVASVAGRTGAVTLNYGDLQNGTGVYLAYKPNDVACNAGEILSWDGAKWVCAVDADAGGDITGVSAGAGLLGGATTGNAGLSVNIGTGPNQVVALDGTSKLPAVDGSALTAVNATKLQTYAVHTAAPTDGQVLKWNNSASRWEASADNNAGGDITDVVAGSGLLGGGTAGSAALSVNTGTGPNQIVALDGTSKLPAVDGSALTNIPASGIVNTATGNIAATNVQGAINELDSEKVAKAGDTMTGALTMNAQTPTRYADADSSNWVALRAPGTIATNVTFTLPNALGTSGQILSTDAAGNLTWIDDANAGGDITDVTAGNGLLGGGTTGNAALSVNIGTGANQVVALDGTAKLPAVDGSNLSAVNATKLQTYAVHTAAPSDGQVLKWNASATRWEASADANAGGDITDVTAGNGLLGGGTAGNAALSVNVGTGANQIVQLDGTSKLPAVDGSALTAINAVKLQTYAVSSTAPTAGKVLGWNGTTSMWEPVTVAGSASGITNVAAGNISATDVQAAINELDTEKVAKTGDTMTGALTLNAQNQARFADADSSNWVALRSPSTLASNITLTLPQVLGSAGQVLQTDATGNLSWLTLGGGGDFFANGSVPMTGNLMMNAQNGVRYGDSDSSNWVALRAPGTITTNVTFTLPNALGSNGQILATDASGNLTWVNDANSGGDITDVTAGNGLLGGGTSGNAALSVNIGTGANQVVALDGTSKLPAVDGSNLTAVNATKLQTYAVHTAAPANGQVLKWNGSASRWEASADTDSGGDITDVVAGTGLLGGGTAGSATLSVNVGTGANQIVQLDGTSKLPAVDGSALTAINAVKLQTYAVSSTAPTAGKVLGWNGTTSMWEPVTVSSTASGVTNVAAGNIAATDVQAAINELDTEKVAKAGDSMTGALTMNAQNQTRYADADSSNWIALRSPSTLASNITLTLPQVLGSAGQVLQTDASGNLSWLTLGGGGDFFANGSVPMTGNLMMNAQNAARFGDSDSSNWVALRAPGTVTSNVTFTLPNALGTNGQILATDASGNMTWINAPTGDITDVTAGNGLLGGGTSGNAALSVNIGTGANQVVALDGTSKLPAVDGSNLTAVNATKLQTYAVHTAAPADGQVLKWNASATRWEASTDANAGGDITDVVAGTGLLGGGTAGSATLSVNVGTGANQIVQLDGTSKLPAVDGSALTAVNAVKLQTYNISSTAPTAGKVLGWNGSTSMWEPITVASTASGITNVAAGNIAATDVQAAINELDTEKVAKAGDTMTGALTLNAQNQTRYADADSSNWIALRSPSTLASNITLTLPQVLGTAGQVLQTDSAGNLSWLTLGGGGDFFANGSVPMTGNLMMNAQNAARFGDSDSSNWVALRSPATVATNVTFTLPNALGSNGQILATDASGNLTWVNDANSGGDITDVTAGNGLLGGGTSGSAALSVNIGTGANQVIALDGTAKLPAVDGSNLTAVNATKLQTYAVHTAAPLNGQVLKWNGSATRWEASADTDSGGDITEVYAGSGLLGGGTSGSATLSVNVGTGPNQIVKLDGTSKLPAVDGSALTAINAVKLQTYNVSSAAPTAGKVLGWNGTTSMWEPVTVAGTASGITNVAAGNIAATDVQAAINELDTEKVAKAGDTMTGALTMNAQNQTRYADADSSNWVALRSPSTLASNITLTLPQVLGSAGQVLQTDATGNLSWLTLGGGGDFFANGSVPMTGNLMMNAQNAARFGDSDSSNWVALRAPATVASNVTFTLPNALGSNGQILATDASGNLTWVNDANSGGDITDVTAGNGLLGGGTSGNAALSVNIGTGANQVVALDGTSKLPAVDGSNLTSVNATKLQTYAVHNAAPANGQVLKWNGSATRWEASADTDSGGDITEVYAGTGLLGGGTSGSATLSVNVGTGPNQIVKLDGTSKLPAVDGSALTLVNATKLQTYNVSATAPTAGKVLGWNGTTSMWEPVSVAGTASGITNVAAGNIAATDVQAAINELDTEKVAKAGDTMTGALTMNAQNQTRYADADSSNWVALRSPSTLASNITLTLPQVLGSAGQVLQTDASGNLSWLTLGGGGDFFANGSVPMTGNLMMNAQNNVRFGDSDSSNWVALRAPGVVGTNVTFTLPNALGSNGQILSTDASGNMTWISAPTGDITDVTAGNGLLGGGTSGNAALSVNIGTGANQVVALDGTSKLPAVDGSNLTAVNATKLQTYAVHTAAPTNGQVLKWNGSATRWEASADTDSGGDITEVFAGTGLLGGGTSGSATLSVNVGTGPNQIVKLDGTSKLPAVDGSALTFVNATKLQTYNVSSIAPTAGKVLGWNGTTSMWEPVTVAGTASGITNVAAGNIAATDVQAAINELDTEKVAKSGDTMTGALTMNAQSQARFADSDSSNWVALRSPAALASNITLTLPQVLGSAGQVLQTDASGNLSWLTLGGGGDFFANGSVPMTGNLMMNAQNAARFGDSDSSNWIALRSPATVTTNVTFTLPNALGSNGQILSTDASGNMTWINAPTGDITDVTAGNGLLGGGTSGNAALSVNIGTGANQVVALDGTSKLPAVDGSNLTSVNATKLQTYAVHTAAPTNGQVLKWNGSATRWEASADIDSGGDITEVYAGTGLLGGGTSGSATLSVNVGTGPNQIVKLDGTSKLPAVDGSALTALNAVKLQTYAVSTTAPTAGKVLGWNGTTSMWEPVTVAGSASGITNTPAGNISATEVQAAINELDTEKVAKAGDTMTGALTMNAQNQTRYADADSSNWVALRSPSTLASNITLTLPQVLGSAGQVLQTDAAGNLSWISLGGGGDFFANGSVPMTGNLMMNAQNAARFGDSDSSNWVALRSPATVATNVTFTLPNALGSNGQILSTDASGNMTWINAPTGDITDVTAGNGLLGGGTSGNAALSVNIGTGANQVVALDGTSKLPAVDGSNLTSVNATKLQTYAVHTAAPTNGQVLKWNGSATRWEASADTDSGGDITEVYAGTGLLGGGTSGSATLSVNVGTGPNQIVKLDGTSKLPAVDGSALTAVNAVKLQTYSVAATAPTAGKVLGWNGTTSMWEPVTVATSASGITNVAAGNIAATDVQAAINELDTEKVAKAGDTMIGALTMNAQNQTRYADADSSNWVALRSPATITSNITLTLPRVLGSAGQVLQTDATGNLSWLTLGGGGDFFANGSVPMTAGIQGFAGTTALPGYTFSGDTDTGIYRSAANEVGIATGGLGRVLVDSSGNVAFGGTLVPSTRVDVYGGTTVRRYGTPTFPFQLVPDSESLHTYVDDATAWFISEQDENTGAFGGFNFVMDDDGSAVPSFIISKKSDTSGLFVVEEGGNVGVGTTTPSAKLQVEGVILAGPQGVGAGNAGQIRFEELTANGGNYAALRAPDALAADRVWTLPTLLGSSGQILSTDGSGNMTWIPAPAGGDFLANGTVAMTAGLQGFSGTSALPGYTFSGDTDTGAYRPGANLYGVSTGGTERLRVDAAGFVGIGTTSPSHKLQVVGGNIVTDNDIGFSASSAGSTATGIHAPAGNTLGFRTASAERMRIDINGNVAVGTVSPSARLHVEGGAILAGPQAAGAGNGGQMRLGELAANGYNYVALRAPDSLAADRVWTLPTLLGTSGQILSTDGSGNMTWIPAPAGGDFLANGTVAMTAGLQGFSGTSALPGYTFSGDTDTGIYRPSANAVGIVTQGSERMRFDSTGLVGIGTSNPTFGLDVAGDGRFSASTGRLYIKDSDTLGTNNAYRATLEFRDSGDNQVGFIGYGSASNTHMYISNESASDLIVQTQSSERMRITSTGALGIGTTAPSAKLHVDGGVILAGPQAAGAGNGGQVRFGELAANGNNYVALRAPDALAADRVWTLPTLLGTSGQLLTTDGSGNLSWVNAGGAGDFMANGTVAMTAGLQGFSGTSALPGYTFSGDTDTGIYRPGADQVALSTAGSMRLYLGANGNIGVGTSVAHGLLQVGVGANLGSASGKPGGVSNKVLIVSDNVSLGSVSHVVQQFDGTRNPKAELFVKDDVAGAGAWGLWQSWSSSGAQPFVLGIGNSEYMRVSTAGNVGFGTSTPSATLHVEGGVALLGPQAAGAGNGGQLRFGELAANGFNYAALRAPDALAADRVWTLPTLLGTSGQILSTDGSGNMTWIPAPAGGDFMANGTVAMTAGLQGFSGTSALPGYTFSGDTDTGAYRAAANTYAISTQGSERLRVQPNGFVGIGTASPTSELTVSGSVDANAFLGLATDTAAAPSFTWTGDLDTGVFRPAANTAAVSTQGTERVRFHATGGASIGISTLSTGAMLDVGGGAIAASPVATGAGNAGQVRFYELAASGTNYAALRAPDALAADRVWTLPTLLGTSGQLLTTDGSGNLSWVNAGGAGDFMANGTVAMTAGLQGFSGTSALPGYAFSGDTDTGTYRPAANVIGFSTQASERMRIDATGNIGVGVTAPSYALQVAGIIHSGTSLQTVSSFGTSIYISGTDGSGGYGSLIRYGGSGTNAGVLQIQGVGNAPRLTIDASGNIGIGNTTPSSRLHVEGGAITAGPVSASAGGAGQVRFEELSANGSNYVAFRAPDALAADRTWTLPTLLGTSGQILSTDGAGNMTWIPAPAGGDFMSNGTVAMSAGLQGFAGTAALPSYSFSGDTDTGMYRGAANEISFSTQGTARVRIGDEGYVGIGTTAPTTLLQIGTGIFIGEGGPTGNSATGSDIHFSSGGLISSEDSFAINIDGDNTTNTGNFTVNKDAYTASAVELFRVQENGYVGIGTSAPSATLDVSGGDLSALFGADDGATTRTNSTVKVMRLGSPHYTNAEEPLGVLYASSSSTANIVHLGSGTATMNAPTELRFYTAPTTTTTTGTERLRITGTGNIGIGTAAPTTLLQIGTSIFIGEGGLAGNTAVGSDIHFAAGGLISSEDSFAINIDGDNSTTTGNFTINKDAYTASAVELFRVQENGNVGIGTAVPSARLQVEGGVMMLGPQAAGAGNGGQMRFGELAANGYNYAALRAPDALAADRVWTLPTLLGTSGQILSTDGSGNMTWIPAPAGGDFLANGTVAMTGALQATSGTSALPSITFSGDTDTGIYRVGANTVGIATGGTMAASFDNIGNINLAGNLGVNAAAPSSSIMINSAMSVSANGTRLGLNNILTLDDTAALTANRVSYGALNESISTLSDANQGAFTLGIYGAFNRAKAGASAGTPGAAAAIVGAYNTANSQSSSTTAISNAFGSQNVVSSTGTADITSAVGTYSTITQNNAGSGITTAYGYRAGITNTAGTIGTAYLMYGSYSGTFGVKYGTYMTGEDKNYFSNAVGIGTTTPSGRLHVEGGAIYAGPVTTGAGNAGTVRFEELTANGNNFVALRAPDALAADRIWTLPTLLGTAGQLLSTDGSGNMTWIPAPAGGDFMANGTVAMTAGLQGFAGTSALPGFTFSGDTDTGVYRPAANVLAFATQASERVRIDATGNVGIGMTSGGEKLEVAGNVKGTAFISTSDRRLKSNIRPADGLAKLLRLNGVRYEWKNNGVTEMGVIAQDVEEIFPEVVVTDAVTGMKAVKYNNLIAPMIESTKEIYGMCETNAAAIDKTLADLAAVVDRVEVLEKENKDLKRTVQSLEQRLEALEKALQK